MGKMKETAPKGKKNQSTAMTAPGDGDADRNARELAIAQLSQLGTAGYEKMTAEAEGKLHELEIVEKADLEGVSFTVIDAKFNKSTDFVNEEGEYSDYMFVTVWCEADGKVRAFTDGGSGIRGQIGALTRASDGELPPGGITPTDPKTWIPCPGGLKASKPYKNKINGATTITFRLSSVEKDEKVPARASGNSRPQARA